MQTITHQQIVDHGQRMIQLQLDAATETARRYLDQTRAITWLCAFNLVSERHAAIQNIAFTLGSLDSFALQSNIDPIANDACAQIDALQDEMREFMSHNSHTA